MRGGFAPATEPKEKMLGEILQPSAGCRGRRSAPTVRDRAGRPQGDRITCEVVAPRCLRKSRLKVDRPRWQDGGQMQQRLYLGKIRKGQGSWRLEGRL